MAETRYKVAPPRPATAPLEGGARDTLPGAAAAALTGWMLSEGVPMELSILAGAFAMGVMTWGRKQLLEHLYKP